MPITCNYKSLAGVPYLLEISGGVSGEVRLYGKQGVVISMNGSDTDLHKRIISTSATFSIMVDSILVENFITDLVTSHEQKYTTKVYEGTKLIFVGYLLNDSIVRRQEYRAGIQLTAADPFKLMKGITYANNAALLSYRGNDTIHEHFMKCFAEVPIATSFSFTTDWRPSGVGGGDPLTKIRVAHSTFYKAGFFGVSFSNASLLRDEFFSCYEVLEMLLTSFNMRVYQSQGVFNFEQISHSFDGGNTFYYGGASGTVGVSTPVVIDREDYTRLNKPLERYIPALRHVIVKYVAGGQANILKNYSWKTDDDDLKEIHTMNVPEKAYIAAVFSIRHRLAITNPALAIPTRLKFRIRIKLVSPSGTESIARTTKDIGTHNVNYQPISINTNDGVDVWSSVQSASIPPTQFLTVSNYQETTVNIRTPEISEEDDVVISVQIELVGLFDGLGNSFDNSEYSIDWIAKDHTLRVVNLITVGNESEDDYEIHKSEGDQRNSEVVEFVSHIGDAPDQINYRKLQSESGSEWVDTDSWSSGLATGGTRISTLLAKEMLEMRKKPTELFDGTIWRLKPLYFNNRIDIDGTVYIILRGKKSTGVDEVSGVWASIGHGPSVKDTIGDTIILDRLDIPIGLDPGSPPDSNFGSDILEPPRSVNYTNERLPDAVGLTSIPINKNIYSPINEGDSIRLVDQTTGNIERFTVIQDLTPTDNSLLIINKTLDAPIPAGTPIIVDSLGSGGKLYEEFENVTSNKIAITNTLPDTTIFSEGFIKKNILVYLNGVKCRYVTSAPSQLNRYTINSINNEIEFSEALEGDDYIEVYYPPDLL